MTKAELVQQIQLKKSLLCTGLDTEISKFPSPIPKVVSNISVFNKKIIEATKDFSVAYKINTAFYEQYGAEGWVEMEKTLQEIPHNIFTIADAKRGDIGNTSSMYARAFFETLHFDAITVAPYMGEDSLRPFLEFKNKWVICLGLTSNAGYKDFQLLEYEQKKLYERVIESVCKWGNENNLMFVIGATRGKLFAEIRKLIPEHFLLVPGIGAQGGSLEEVCEYGLNKDYGLLINSSRAIIYASSDDNFENAAKIEAQKNQQNMSKFLSI